MYKESQSVNTNYQSHNSNSHDNQVPTFRSFAIKLTGSIRAHWGIEQYCLKYISKFKFIISADIQGCINVWSSETFKKRFQLETFDTDIFEIIFFEISDLLLVESHHLSLYKISKTGIHKVVNYKNTMPIRVLSIANSDYFALSLKEKIKILKKTNLAHVSEISPENIDSTATGFLHYFKKNLMITGYNDGYVAIYDIASSFKKIHYQKIGKCEVEVSIGSNEKLDIVLICRNSGFVEIWKLSNKNTLNYVTQVKIYIDRIYNYIPAIVNHEDCVLIAGLSFEVIVLYLEKSYKHERILNRKYSAILPIPEKKVILLGNNVQRDIDIANYP